MARILTTIARILAWLASIAKGETVNSCPKCGSENVVGPTCDTETMIYIAYCKSCDWMIRDPDLKKVHHALELYAPDATP